MAMAGRPRDLTSDPAAERLAEPSPSEEALRAEDARGGGDPAQAPRSLAATQSEADDEPLAAGDDWDGAERL